MAMISCSECGNKISSTASICPNCGKKPPKSHPFLKALMVIILLAFGIKVLGNLLPGSPNNSSKTTSSSSATASSYFNTGSVVYGGSPAIGCRENSDLDNFFTYIRDKDFHASALMISTGKCKELEGAKLHVTDHSIMDNRSRVRAEGSLTELWIPNSMLK